MSKQVSRGSRSIRDPTAVVPAPLTIDQLIKLFNQSRRRPKKVKPVEANQPVEATGEREVVPKMTKLKTSNGIKRKPAKVKKARKAKRQGKGVKNQPKVLPQKTLEVEEEKEHLYETSLHTRSTMADSTADPGEGKPLNNEVQSDFKIRILLKKQSTHNSGSLPTSSTLTTMPPNTPPKFLISIKYDPKCPHWESFKSSKL